MNKKNESLDNKKAYYPVNHFQLIDVAKRKHDDKIIKAYWITYRCASKMISEEGKVFTWFEGTVTVWFTKELVKK